MKKIFALLFIALPFNVFAKYNCESITYYSASAMQLKSLEQPKQVAYKILDTKEGIIAINIVYEMPITTTDYELTKMKVNEYCKNEKIKKHHTMMTID